MIIKIFGTILVVTSFLVIGIEYNKAINKRIVALNEMIELLSALKIKINYEYSSIPEILRDIYSANRENMFLMNCIYFLDDGEGLKNAWNHAVEKYAKQFFLTKKDTSILYDFSIGLGDSDVNGQITNILLYIDMLKASKKIAEAEVKDKSRVSLSLSVFSGLIFVIILI